MSESQLNQKIHRLIKKYYPSIMRIKISDRSRSGLPDLLLMHDSKHLWVELKTSKGKVSNIQFYTMVDLRRHGCNAEICSNIEHIKQLIKKYFNLDAITPI